jgi:hypothetical protein
MNLNVGDLIFINRLLAKAIKYKVWLLLNCFIKNWISKLTIIFRMKVNNTYLFKAANLYKHFVALRNSLIATGLNASNP